MSRDDFPNRVKDNLARRAGFLCSNPDCRKLTVGSNKDGNKATLIGIAAHITAASEGGPRYDNSITNEERSSIDNGIWLCSNCASLIDRDPHIYNDELLRRWKQIVEIESAASLLGKKVVSNSEVPYLEVDLRFAGGSRLNRGYSKKNPLKSDENGNYFYDISENPIIHWSLNWKYDFVILNQSSYPAFNIRIESIGDIHFTFLEEISKINRLAPLHDTTLQAKYGEYFEGTGIEADKILKPRIPNKFDGMQIKLTYFDEQRQKHHTLVTFQNNEISNNRIEEQSV